MPARHIHLSGVDDVPAPLVAGVDRLRSELAVPTDFPADVLAAAAASAEAGPAPDDSRADLTAIELVTIDPEGSMDLDQALFLERSGSGDGYTVWYAIADVAAWVTPGGPVDLEAHRRGQTFYAPNEKASLHPPVLSEAAASLLADGRRRPALVWQIGLDARAATTSVTVQRAWVQSRARLTYAGVQADLDAGTASASLQLLKEVGEKLLQREADRGGVSLNLPEQEVSVEGDTWVVHFRQPLPVEGWNAEISLLTGISAASLMLKGGVGILRTLPPADAGSLATLRRVASALHIDWPHDMGYPGFVRSLDPTQPAHLAMLTACTALFRGAGYTVIGPDTDPASVQHAALAADYAHATAPLRRLVDRYVGEICVHLCAGTPVPQWVLDALPALPQEMTDSDRRAKKFERGIVDLVEALQLQGREGETFTGVVVEEDPSGHKGTLVVAEPAVEAPVSGSHLPLGQDIEATLTRVDTAVGRVEFQQVGAAGAAAPDTGQPSAS